MNTYISACSKEKKNRKRKIRREREEKKRREHNYKSHPSLTKQGFKPVLALLLSDSICHFHYSYSAVNRAE